MEESLAEIISNFALEGRAVRAERYGQGHINATYLVESDRGRRYILQRVSRRAFGDVDGLMENIVGVTDYFRARCNDPRAAIRVIRTVRGENYLNAGGEAWRVYDFIEGTVCLQSIESDRDFYESAIGFGRFLHTLSDYPAATLHETIPNFHNTPDRYRIFREVLRRDPLGRASGVQREIDFALRMEEEMRTLQTLRESGVLALRVTHNDTKLNNVLLDAETHKAVCVIDLDTVMPGLAAYDFGDSIRFGASTAAEDEEELDRVGFDLGRYETFADGFLAACGGLSQDERDSLPLGAKTMTMECGVRFLTDYLDGDRYFAAHREAHNLLRARTQFRLVTEMEKKWDAMRRIIGQCR